MPQTTLTRRQLCVLRLTPRTLFQGVRVGAGMGLHWFSRGRRPAASHLPARGLLLACVRGKVHALPRHARPTCAAIRPTTRLRTVLVSWTSRATQSIRSAPWCVAARAGCLLALWRGSVRLTSRR